MQNKVQAVRICKINCMVINAQQTASIMSTKQWGSSSFLGTVRPCVSYMAVSCMKVFFMPPFVLFPYIHPGTIVLL